MGVRTGIQNTSICMPRRDITPKMVMVVYPKSPKTEVVHSFHQLNSGLHTVLVKVR